MTSLPATTETERVCRPLPRAFRLFATLSLAGLLLSLAPAFLPPPFGFADKGFRALLPPLPGFDFYDYLTRMRHAGSPDFFSLPGYPWYYAPGGALAYGFFYLFCPGDHWLPGYLVLAAFCATGVAAGLWQLFRLLRRNGFGRVASGGFLLAALVTSWPIAGALQRGNLEAAFWVLLAFAILMLRRGRWWTAAIALGVVAAFKVYPALCFALFLRERRWKELAVGLATMAAVTIGGLRYLSADLFFAAKGSLLGMERWTHDYALGRGAGQRLYDHAFYELVKEIWKGHAPTPGEYMLIAGVVGMLLWFGRVRLLPLTNQVLFVIVACVALPPASFNYTLVNVYIAWAWVVAEISEAGAAAEGLRSSMVMALFAVVLAPTLFVTLHHAPVSGTVKCLALLSLMGLAAVIPLNWREESDGASASSQRTGARQVV